MQPLQNPFDLEGKTILVTGCNRGIGKAMAIALAQAGAEIIGVSTKLALTESQIEKDIRQIGENSPRIAVTLGPKSALPFY